jgi:hypothetical protein
MVLKIKIEGEAVEVVLLGWDCNFRHPRNIHFNSSACKQAIASRLLRPLLFRPHKHDNLPSNSGSNVLAWEEERNKGKWEMISIFISHSRRDEWFIVPLAQALKTMDIEPILLELETPIPYPLPEAIKNNLKRASAVFVLITPNVTDNQTTRDNVLWEIAHAYALGKPIYVFKDKRSTLPVMVSYVTTYHEFNMHDQEQVKTVFDRAVTIAQEIARQDKVNAVYCLLLTTLGPLGIGLIALMLAHVQGTN